MALTTEQRTDMQADLGIAADEGVFTDAELDRLYERAAADYDVAMVYALDQLLMDAAKFNDYTAGSSSEKKSQVFDHLLKVRGMRAEAAGLGYGKVSGGVIDLDFMDKGD